MKVSVSSYSFSKYREQTKCDDFAICDLAKEIGFEGIEFAGLNSEEPLEHAAKVREYCEKIGLSIVSYTIGADFLNGDPEKTVENMCRQVDIAAALGAPLMRHDVCYSLKKEPLYNWRKAADEMAPYIRKVTEYAAEKGVRTCSENHGYIFQAPERVEALILAVNHENYGWLCDIGNFLCADAEPTKSVAIAAPYTFHVHAKDFLFKKGEKPEGFFETTGCNGLRGTVLGHGVVPVKQCLNILKKAGYDGWVSLEFEGMEDNKEALKIGYNYLKQLTAE